MIIPLCNRCQECYSVISQYLKGDSRKNENYLARFIEFFRTQVSTDQLAELLCMLNDEESKLYILL